MNKSTKKFTSINNGWSATAGDIEVGVYGVNGSIFEPRIYWTDGKKTFSCDAEIAGDPYTKNSGYYAFFPSADKWRWERPHQAGELSEADKKAILADLKAGLSAMGQKLYLDYLKK